MPPTADAPALGISRADLAFLRKAAQLFVPDYDVVVYGSRARGTERTDSDLDLAVYGSTENLDRAVLEFKNVMAHALVRPTVSVVQMNLVEGLLARDVLRDGVPLYEGAGEWRRRRESSEFGRDAPDLRLA